MQINTIAQTGFQNASSYDIHRPAYPTSAISSLLSHLHLIGVQGGQIVEVGSGTGKFTEHLAKRDEGFEILAVEPHAGMRGELVRKGLGERVVVVDGDAAHLPVEENWGDAVVAAQAFHWFANEESLKEIHRALRPGGILGMIWNVDDYNGPRDWTPTTSLDQKLKQIIIDTEDGHNRFRHMKWKEVFENQTETTPLQALVDTFTKNFPSFSLPLGEEAFKWTVWLSEEHIWSRISTLSQIANLDDKKKEEVHQQVLEVLKDDGAERNEKGEVALHGCTYLSWTSRV